MAIRPAPTTVPVGTYSALQLTNPPVSTTVFIDTDRGSIEIELAVLDAPLTTDNFIALARKGYFNGLGIHRVVPNFVVQDGDPRGDGEGGPGYTIRDELNQRPYLRGAVGMALDWKDTGGSQFFITHSPQPHLDAKYTVFGRVVSGADVVDKIQQWDVIRAVRVWDGETNDHRSSCWLLALHWFGVFESLTEIEKGATAAPFYPRERSAYRFLPAFFFPPLAFFAIVLYPPLQCGIDFRERSRCRSGCRLARAQDADALRLRSTSTHNSQVVV